MPDTFRQSPYRNDPIIKGAALITGHKRYADWFADPDAPDYAAKVESYCRLTEQLNNVPPGTRYEPDGRPSKATERAARLRGGNPPANALQGDLGPLPAKMPSLLNQAVGLAKHIKKEITVGGFKVPDSLAAERLEICRKCDNLINNRCRLCGCYMPVKTTRSVAQCPMDPPLWVAVGNDLQPLEKKVSEPVKPRRCNGT